MPAPTREASIAHSTPAGDFHLGDSKALLGNSLGRSLRGQVNLILTSPPFPLNQKKSYGNLQGDAYREWFVSLAPLFSDVLADDGSIVIEIGNAWVPGRPVQTLLTLESLLGFVKNVDTDFRLIQEFISYNPSRLPSPAQWVTVERSRVTDSFTHVWWIAKTDRPKADNTRVLRPYSKAMKLLLKRQRYNAGTRPSQFSISETGFLRDQGGAIAHNVFEIDPMDEKRDPRLPYAFEDPVEQARIPDNALGFANTNSADHFHRVCRERGIRPHPARMPVGLASFFIKFLTEPGDLVLDPFAGSNTTGYAAEKLGRKWVAIEALDQYAEQAEIRLSDPALGPQEREETRYG